MRRTLTQIAVATVALIIAQALVSVLAPLAARQVEIGLRLVMISTMLIAGVLLLVAAHARDTGVSAAPHPDNPTTLHPYNVTTLPWLKLLGCGVIYLGLYIAAGLFIAWPVVEQHYRQWPMPNPAVVFPLQIVRGAAFGLTLLLLVRQTIADRLMAGMIGGLLLSVLGGVAPLLLPNAYLPDVVRLAHLAEVVVSNFAFGLLAAWWLKPEEGQQAR